MSNTTEKETQDYGLAQHLITPFHSTVVTTRRHAVLRDLILERLPDEQLSGLDIGCGTGALGQSIQQARQGKIKMSGIDVHVWPTTVIPVMTYDGGKIPFPDKSVDFALLIDVLHHCDDPLFTLDEAMRVSRRYVIIKDHICENAVDDAILRFMDWFGNRGYGVQLPYKYFSRREWFEMFCQVGANVEKWETRLGLYPWPFNHLFEREMHLVTRLSIDPTRR